MYERSGVMKNDLYIYSDFSDSKDCKMFTYEQIIDVINRLSTDARIAKLFYVSGGIVPWIVSNTNSNRMHSDLDLMVKKEHMPIIREVLKEYNLYNVDLDSLFMEKSDGVDFGISAVFDGVPVGFYPYEVIDNGIVQRSFSPKSYQYPDLKTRIISDMKDEDYVQDYKLEDGSIIKTTSLEVIKVQKENERHSDKDIYDLAQIDRIGYDESRYLAVKNALSNMKTEKIQNNEIGMQMNQPNGAEKTGIRIQKENLIKSLINKIALQYGNSGVEKKHINKALKYYLSLDGLLDDNITIETFKNSLVNIEEELFKLAINTERNFIKELESYSKPSIVEAARQVFEAGIMNKEGIEVGKSEASLSSISSVKLSSNTLSEHHVPDELIDRNTSNPNMDIKKGIVLESIDRIAKEYSDRGIFDGHIVKAKEHYLNLPDIYNDNLSLKDFELLLRSIENELYILAENTKNNYIKQLKECIIKNPRIKREEKNKITSNIYLNRAEKESTVIRLIDSIASEYSGAGVFDRHIKKAYGIFLNRPEIANDDLSFEGFNAFLLKIEEELYELAEQTKRNYEIFRKEMEGYGKVIKKGSDYH